MLLPPSDPHNGQGPLSSLFRPRGTFQSTPICGHALPFEHSRVEIAFDARFSSPASPALFSGLIRIVPLPAPSASSLAGRSLPPSGFDLSEPLLKRFSPEENPPADSHCWEVRDPSNFAIDNVAEVGSRTSDERGCLGQIQDLGHTCVLDLDGAFRFAKALSIGCYWMEGAGRHIVLSFLRPLRRRKPWNARCGSNRQYDFICAGECG